MAVLFSVAFLFTGIARASINYTNDSGYRQKIIITQQEESEDYGTSTSSWTQMLYPGQNVIYDDYDVYYSYYAHISFSLDFVETLVGPTVSFRAVNGQWVCAEGGGGREMVANRNGDGPWERFVFQDRDGGNIESGDVGFLRSDHGQFLCAENGGGSVLNATRIFGGPWEEFKIWKVDGDGNLVGGTISSGDTVAVTSVDGYYWCAESGGGSTVVANRIGVGSWERFTITIY